MRAWLSPSRPPRPLLSQSTIAACVVTLLLTACNFGSEDFRPDPRNVTILIYNDGVLDSDRDVTILLRGTARFSNQSLFPHEMYSDPHPGHTGCPEINVGLIPPNADRASGPLNTPGVCNYHDETQPDNTKFHGTIRIQ